MESSEGPVFLIPRHRQVLGWFCSSGLGKAGLGSLSQLLSLTPVGAHRSRVVSPGVPRLLSHVPPAAQPRHVLTAELGAKEADIEQVFMCVCISACPITQSKVETVLGKGVHTGNVEWVDFSNLPYHGQCYLLPKSLSQMVD